MSDPLLFLIAAVGRNGIIGGDGKLPWRLPSDLKRFKEITMGKPMLMGRKTFEGIGRPLPGRETIVLTRDRSFAAEGVHVAHDLAGALELARRRAQAMGAGSIAVVGGGEIYAQTIGLAQRLDVTEVDLAPAGDARFPAIGPDWVKVREDKYAAGPGDEAPFTVSRYERR